MSIKNQLFAVIFGLCASVSVSSNATADAGVINGIVKDQNGRAAVGVTVHITEDACRGEIYRHSSETNSTGNFVLDLEDESVLPEDVYIFTLGNKGDYYTVSYQKNAGSTTKCEEATPFKLADLKNGTVNASILYGSRISGTVYNEASKPVKDAAVYIMDSCNSDRNVVVDYTDENGKYSIPVFLEKAIVKVETSAENWNYVSQYRVSNSKGVLKCEEAVPVAVPGAGKTVTGVDFRLPSAGAISGKIAGSDGKKIEKAYVNVSTDPCGENVIANGESAEDGSYFVSGLPAGEKLYLNVNTSDVLQGMYIGKPWSSKGTAKECKDAEAVTATVNYITKGIDFVLQPAGAVSGKVVNSAGQPVAGVIVQAFTGMCGLGYVTDTLTQADGSFFLTGLPAGNVYLAADVTEEFVKDSKYLIDQHWNGQTGSSNCAEAKTVPVVANKVFKDIKFVIKNSGTVSGTVVDSYGNGIYNILVVAYATQCGEAEPLSFAYTDVYGKFALNGLETSKVYLLAYDEEGVRMSSWFQESGEMALFCDTTSSVPVVKGADMGGYLIPMMTYNEYATKSLKAALNLNNKAIKAVKKGKKKAAIKAQKEAVKALNDMYMKQLSVREVSAIEKNMKQGAKKMNVTKLNKAKKMLKKLMKQYV